LREDKKRKISSFNKQNEIMNIVLFTLLFAGMLLIAVGFIRSQRHCPPAKIEYKFIPRSFQEEQENPVPVTDIFARMFMESSVFIGHESSKLLGPPSQRTALNRFFISQN